MIGLLCTNASLGVGFEAGRDDIALVAGRGAEVCDLLRRSGTPAACVEEALADDPERSLVLSGANVVSDRHNRAFLVEHGVRAWLPFKPSRKLEARAREAKATLLACDAQLVRQLENKLSLPGIATDAGVRCPASTPATLDDAFVAAAVDRTYPAVFQPAIGFAGAGTHLVADHAALAALAARIGGATGKLADLVEGTPVTAAGCALPAGPVLVGPAVLQLTGVPELSGQPFGSSGNDLSLDPAGSVAQAVRAVADRVGRVLIARGFRGLFGIDAVVDPAGDVWLIEVNPRVTASLSVALQLQAVDGGPTLLDGHLISFDALATGADAAGLTSSLTERCGAASPHPATGPAASLICYHQGRDPLQPAPLAPGRYRFGGDQLERLDDALHVTALRGDDECVVLPASSGLAVSGGAEVCRLVLRRAVAADATARTLDPEVRALVLAVRERLGADLPRP